VDDAKGSAGPSEFTKEIQSAPDRLSLDALLERVEKAKKKGVHGNSASGAVGEELAVFRQGWRRRPVGDQMKNLMWALKENQILIEPTSFDALVVPKDVAFNLSDRDVLKESVSKVTFVEIKSGRRKNMPEDFTNFFFALTFREIQAAMALGDRHVVALINLDKLERGIFITDVWSLLKRATSSNWQLSIQLGPDGVPRLKSDGVVREPQIDGGRRIVEQVFSTVAEHLAAR
jgi:hypothetical protein